MESIIKPILFALPGSETLATHLRAVLPCVAGDMQIHQFPDGESCPRFLTPVVGRDVVFVCAFDRPDEKMMGLYLAACVARELGARSIGFVIPYLPYMRQDAVFNEGEGITSVHFAKLISSCCDWLVTVDPHLHRHHALSDIYSIASRVVHAAPEISKWVSEHVKRPIIIGPDSESEQWVAEVARAANCPYTVLQKIRSGDRMVEVSIPDTTAWVGMTPVLVDDIVSTARTMAVAAKQIVAAHRLSPICIAVHPLFAGDAYDTLQMAGVERIISCNTIQHETNQINLCKPIAVAVEALLKENRENKVQPVQPVP